MTIMRRLMTVCLCMLLSACGFAENTVVSLAEDSARKFNDMATNASSVQEAQSCMDFYKRMEMDFLKFKIKHGMEVPLARFRRGTGASFSRLQEKFKVQPEYGAFENTIRKLGAE